MGIFKRKEIGKDKYLCVGPFQIKYKVIKHDNKSKVKLGPLNIDYVIYEKDGSSYIKILGMNFCMDKIFHNRKAEHYKNRTKLNDTYCKNILRKELSSTLGYTPNIDTPKTFNEKILWLKFNDHNPLITKCCDKFAVKEYIKEVVGDKYVLPNIGVWYKVADVDFSNLPDNFALKVNWSSGYNIIVKDKKVFDESQAIKKLNLWMHPSKNSYYDTFNWGYKNMKPVIYAEPYIEQCDGQVYDYKFFICNGKFEFLFIATDRLDNRLTYTFFDKNFNHIPCEYGNKPNADPLPTKPHNFDKMIEIAERLAKPFKFVRVDFYELNENDILVGEMTFYSGGGTLPFKPIIWDEELGKKINLE